MGKQAAFTLIELMVTVAVAAILLGIAIPGFAEIIRGTRASADISAITTALSLARSEAVKRNGVACVVTAGWAGGWDVKVDTDGDGDCGDNGDAVIRTFGAIAAGGSLGVNAGGAVTEVSFGGSGARHGGSDYVISYRSLSGACTPRRDRNLTVGATGRTKIEACSS